MGVRRVCVAMDACVYRFPQPVIEGVEEHVKYVCRVVAHSFWHAGTSCEEKVSVEPT
jgi:hypothetical protein